MEAYDKFIGQKEYAPVVSGFDVSGLNSELKDFQDAIVKWACKRGRAAVFADTGLGKTFMQCEWARLVAEYSGGPVIIYAPLAVAEQTIREANKFGVADIKYIRHDSEMDDDHSIYISNYEMQHEINPDLFSGVVLDESSILKNQTGRTRTEMIDRWGRVDYRLSCTATPSPNDFMELGNQAEFLGIMSMTEMLAMFFVNDTGNTGTWRLKGHGEKKFYEWLATWAVVIRKPSDIGFSDEGYDLPKLNIIEHEIEMAAPAEGDLFAMPAQSLTERRAAKKESITHRVELAAKLINDSSESWIAWCHLNDEQDQIEKAVNRQIVSVRGADKFEHKVDGLTGFSTGKYENIVSKPSIAGFGMNWQHTHNMVFTGMDDSFEKFYQAVRRQYRFGQTKEVNVHIIYSDAEGNVKANIERKAKQHEDLSRNMVECMREIMQKEITGATIEKTEYNPQKTMILPKWLGA